MFIATRDFKFSGTNYLKGHTVTLQKSEITALIGIGLVESDTAEPTAKNDKPKTPPPKTPKRQSKAKAAAAVKKDEQGNDNG